MLTEKDYCDYDTCVALAKLGFPRWELPYDILSKKYCLRLYDAQKWLREEKEVYVTVIPEYNEFGPIKGVYFAKSSMRHFTQQ